MLINPYRIAHGAGYQRPPQMSDGRASVEIMLLLGLGKQEQKRGGRQVKRLQKLWKGRRTLIRVGTLNIGTMTVRGRKLADMLEQRNVDILCLLETKWKGSKARNIGGGCNYFTTELMEEKMG